MDLDKKIAEYVQAQMPTSDMKNGDMAWLIGMFKKSKALQKSDFIAWLNSRKATIATEISSEPNVSQAKLNKLEAEDDTIDTIISTF